jgi:hypothetical protein
LWESADGILQRLRRLAGPQNRHEPAFDRRSAGSFLPRH